MLGSRRPVVYGAPPNQVADLHVPHAPPPWPVIVLFHGGFWRAQYGRLLMRPLARSLARGGYAVWNVEYRRVGQPGGGWPGTFEDVAGAMDALEDLDPRLDLTRVITLGHSAGGHLALWVAARHRLPADAPGAAPRVRPTAAVSLAGVPDLAAAARGGAGGAVAEFLGALPFEEPRRYALASPITLVPLGIPQLLVHGAADVTVSPRQSQRYVAAARAAGDAVELLELPGVGHRSPIVPLSATWRAVARRLPALVGGL